MNSFDEMKKHLRIYREDDAFVKKMISENIGIENFAQAFHELVTNYKKTHDTNDLEKEVTDIKKQLKHMSLEQSTLSELVSDYLFIEHYHDDFVHINNGTETEAWANARKLALKHIKENQEDMSHKKHKQETYEHTKKRIISSQKNSNTFDIRPNIKRPGGLI